MSQKDIKTSNPINLKDVKEVEAIKGIYRSTLAYNKDAMLCHFRMLKGAQIPLHNHPNVQIGFVVKGSLKFFKEKGDFIAKTGDSYVFDANEKHGAEVLEDCFVVELFTPYRPEYISK
jgi:quercetin dioxygenase-like cupin family protein